MEFFNGCIAFLILWLNGHTIWKIIIDEIGTRTHPTLAPARSTGKGLRKQCGPSRCESSPRAARAFHSGTPHTRTRRRNRPPQGQASGSSSNTDFSNSCHTERQASGSSGSPPAGAAGGAAPGSARACPRQRGSSHEVAMLPCLVMRWLPISFYTFRISNSVQLI